MNVIHDAMHGVHELTKEEAVFFHQGYATIRSVWGRLHTGSRRRLRTTKQPRDQRPGAVVFCLIEKEFMVD